jgi:hypothetical protein
MIGYITLRCMPKGIIHAQRSQHTIETPDTYVYYDTVYNNQAMKLDYVPISK